MKHSLERSCLKPLKQIRQTEVHPQRNEFQKGKCKGLLSSFNVAQKILVDSKVAGDSELSQVAFAPEFPESPAESAADVPGKGVSHCIGHRKCRQPKDKYGRADRSHLLSSLSRIGLACSPIGKEGGIHV